MADATSARPDAATASIWSALDVVLRQGVQFFVSIILARLLAPEDFGVVALLAFFTASIVALVQGGLSTALIQCQNSTRQEESAIFWWNLLASAILGLLLVAIAPFLAVFFDQPILRALSVAAAIQLVLAGPGEVQSALLARAMRFDLLTRAGVLATVVAGGVAVAAAWYGAGVWALAAQGVVFAGLNSLLVWQANPWRPLLHFHFSSLRRFFELGGLVAAGMSLDLAYTNGVNLLVGKIYGARDLGFFNRAMQTQSMVSLSLSTIVGRVSLPLLSSKEGEPQALRQSAKLAISYSMMLNVPALTGLALLSDEVVAVLFGPQWRPVAPLLSVMALSGMVAPLHLINTHLVMAQGESRPYIANEVKKRVIGVACLIVGSFYGLIGIAWSQVVYNLLSLAVYRGSGYRQLDYGPVKQLKDLTGIVFATAVMAIGVTLLQAAIDFGPLGTLLVCSILGATIYAAVGCLARIAVFRQSFTQLALAPAVGTLLEERRKWQTRARSDS